MANQYGPLGREAGRRLSDTSTGEADWHDDAACARFPVAETDPIFYPPSAAGTVTWSDARELCATCPVIHKCLEEALTFEVSGQATHGFRAGMTPDERVKLGAQLRRGRAAA